ncbi:MAG: hypothetical protein KIT60_06020 [Burkholderiaceae bacterium]|nr:hypothetical protein [Burkholderiaceae bacterium]
MNRLSNFFVAAALAAAVGGVSAQQGAGPGPGPGASAPRGGPGMMGGPMGGRGGPAASAPRGPGMMGGRWGSQYTPGWSMMTPQERTEHQEKMRSMTNRDECRAYMEQHHQQMMERAKDKGVNMPARPRRDACARL